MKAIVLLFASLQLTSCCLLDACANNQEVETTPVQASDKPLPSLESGTDGAKH